MFSWHLARAHRQHRGALLGAMRVLAHIHTFNDAEIIERMLEAVRTKPAAGRHHYRRQRFDGCDFGQDLPGERHSRHSENLCTAEPLELVSPTP